MIYRPIEMPYPAPISSGTFELSPIQQVTPTGNSAGAGYLQSIDRASPFWLAKYTTSPLSPLKYSAWLGWLDQLEGSNYSFLGVSQRNPVPLAYASQMPGALTSQPWGPGAVVTATNYADPNTVLNNIPQGSLTIYGMAYGATLNPGDMISYQSGNMWLLYRVVAPYTFTTEVFNAAWTLTDSSTTVAAYLQQTVTVPNDNAYYEGHVSIQATTGGTSPTAHVLVLLGGGSAISVGININTDTGQIYGSSSAGVQVLPVMGNGSISAWHLILPITNNYSGNTSLTLRMFPSIANYGSGVSTVTATGSNVFFAPQITPGTNLLSSTLLSDGDWTNNALASIVQNASSPGCAGTIAVKPRPQDTIGNIPLVRLGRPACAMKMIGKPQWTDDVSSAPICTISAVQYLERGS
jgi:hypothetical protein